MSSTHLNGWECIAFGFIYRLFFSHLFIVLASLPRSDRTMIFNPSFECLNHSYLIFWIHGYLVCNFSYHALVKHHGRMPWFNSFGKRNEMMGSMGTGLGFGNPTRARSPRVAEPDGAPNRREIQAKRPKINQPTHQSAKKKPNPTHTTINNSLGPIEISLENRKSLESIRVGWKSKSCLDIRFIMQMTCWPIARRVYKFAVLHNCISFACVWNVSAPDAAPIDNEPGW